MLEPRYVAVSALAERRTWAQAAAYCADGANWSGGLEGRLVAIESESKNAEVRAQLPRNTKFWIGLSATAAEWMWHNAPDVGTNFTRWSALSSEPSNAGNCARFPATDEVYLAAPYDTDDWVADDCDQLAAFVCEFSSAGGARPNPTGHANSCGATATTSLPSLASGDGALGAVFPGSSTTDHAGRTIAGIGDINGDGREDFAVTTGNNGFGQTGLVHIVYGRDGSTSPFGNGFNLTDLAVSDGSLGFTLNSSSNTDGFGQAVAGVGDVNGDGVDDFAVAAPNAPASKGTVHVVFGKASAAAFDPLTQLDSLAFGLERFEWIGVDSCFGELATTGIARVGDVNDDGAGDFAFACSEANYGGITGGGIVFVAFGRSPFTTKPTFWGHNAVEFDHVVAGAVDDGVVIAGGDWQRVGTAVVGLRDFNGDGVPDIEISAKSYGYMSEPNEYTASGAVWVVYGQPFSSNIVLSSIESGNGTTGILIRGEQHNGYFGSSVADVGDMDGDGAREIAIGAFLESPGVIADVGIVHVLSLEALLSPGQAVYDVPDLELLACLAPEQKPHLASE